MAPSSKTKLLAVLVLALASLSMAAAQAPPPPSAPASRGNGTCDPLKLRVCGGLLSRLLGGLLPGDGAQCCPLLEGLVDLEAAACVCSALRANVLGVVNLNVPLAIALDRLLNTCGRDVPAGFTCPPPA